MRLASQVWKSPQVVPRDVTSGLGRALELRSFQAGRWPTYRLFVVPVAFIEHRLNRSVTYLPLVYCRPLKWFPTRIAEGGMEEGRKRRLRRGEERGRKSGKRDYRVYAVLPEGEH